MFRAIGRYFRALGYLVVGNIDKARQTLSANPEVVRATFDRVIDEKKKRIHQYKDAVGAMIAQEEKKKSQLKKVTADIERLQKLREGAAAMARKLVEKHNGDSESVKSDPDYSKCQAAFQDFSSTLSEKEERAASLEADITELEKNVSGHKTQLETLLRDLDKIKEEKHATVADLMTAKEEKEIGDLIRGISNDRTNEELQELRDIRDQAKATARISREIAGTDTARSEADFLEYAASNQSSSEFDQLIGLAKDVETSTPNHADATEQERE